jgi:hypothetical protein
MKLALQTTVKKDSSADLVTTIGDVVIARRDMGTSYHLSVVIDDDTTDTRRNPPSAPISNPTVTTPRSGACRRRSLAIWRITRSP